MNDDRLTFDEVRRFRRTMDFVSNSTTRALMGAWLHGSADETHLSPNGNVVFRHGKNVVRYTPKPGDSIPGTVDHQHYATLDEATDAFARIVWMETPLARAVPGLRAALEQRPALGRPFVDILAGLTGQAVRVFAGTWTSGTLREVGPDWLLVDRHLVRLEAVTQVIIPADADGVTS